LSQGLTNRLQRLTRLAPVGRVVGGLNQALLRRGPWPVRLEGQVLLPSTLDRLVVLWLHKLGGGESYPLSLWRRRCRPGAVVVDVGANLGLYALVASRAVGPGGRVVAFEADPENARLLALARRRNRAANLEVRAEAVGAAEGWAELYLRPEHKGDSELAYRGGDRPSTRVPVTTLDASLAREPRVDLLKLDIQGAEALAIQGMERVLEASPRLAVFSEFWPRGLRRCGLEPEAYLDWWRRRGFAVRIIDQAGRRLEPAADHRAVTVRAEKEKELNLLLERRP
jgi:FkbM family methyltransferase